MKLRVYATLLMAFTTLTASISPAQQMWGSGMYGGMQPCAGIGAANGASDDEDEAADLKSERAQLRRDKKEVEKNHRALERELDKVKDQISSVIQPKWANIIFPHMEYKYNCGICRKIVISDPPADTPRSELPPVPAPAKVPVAAEAPTQRVPSVKAEPVTPPLVIKPPGQTLDERPKREPKAPGPRKGPKTDNSMNETVQSRMPAGETTQATMSEKVGPPKSNPGDFQGDDWGPDLGGQNFSSDGSATLCRPNEKPYTMNAWRAICKVDGGRIEGTVCTTKYFQNGDVKPSDANRCASSLERYRRLLADIEKNQKQVNQLDSEIELLTKQIGDLKLAARENRDMEADGGGRTSRRERRSSGPSTGQLIAQTLMGIAPAVLGAYGSYRAAKEVGEDANERNARTGNAATSNPYLFNAIYPYATGALYGAMYGGVNGGFGCSQTIGGMNGMGPMGALGPAGIYGNAGGVFGYPNGMMGGQMGGGMYMPGAGPWGQNGPWGVGGGIGGYPGAAFAGGSAFAGAYAGGAYAGAYAGGAGFPGAYAGGGAFASAGAFAGGSAFSGVPYAGGGYPGIPYAGGGGPYAGGFAGGSAYAGGPYGGGYAGGPYAGAGGPYAGGFAGGFAGGSAYAGVPYAGGGVPYSGGYAGGGAGFPGGAPLMGMDAQLARLRADKQAADARAYSSYISEFESFNAKWSSYFQNSNSSSLYNSGSQYLYSPTVNTGTSPGTPTTTTPGRTR